MEEGRHAPQGLLGMLLLDVGRELLFFRKRSLAARAIEAQKLLDLSQ